MIHAGKFYISTFLSASSERNPEIAVNGHSVRPYLPDLNYTLRVRRVSTANISLGMAQRLKLFLPLWGLMLIANANSKYSKEEVHILWVTVIVH